MTTDQAPPAAALRLRGIRVDFPGRQALRGVDLDVLHGEVTVLAGPNGAGKTTLLEVVAGTRPPSAGTRTTAGAVAFVPQRTAVSDRLPVTVRDVVTVGAWGRTGLWRRLHPEARADVEEAISRLDLTTIARQPFATLSGGQRQRTLLAQGLARRPDVLLLDEPTTGLDAGSGERIHSAMREEAARGATVVCVSHDPALLGSADRVVHLEDGRIVADTRAGEATPVEVPER